MPFITNDLSRRDLLAIAGAAAVTPLHLSAQATAKPAAQNSGERRRELYALLGDLPDRQRPIGGTKRNEVERDGFMLETWDLDLNGIEKVPAYVARPKLVTGRAPAVVY